MDARETSVTSEGLRHTPAQQQQESALSALQHVIQNGLAINPFITHNQLGQRPASSAAAVASTAHTAGGTQEQVTTLFRNFSHLTHSAASSPRQPDTESLPAANLQGDTETAAAAAERHRLTGTPTLDLQAIAKWVEGMLPYMVILAAVFVYHYCTGIFLFLWLLCSLIKANQIMRKVVAQRLEYQAGEVVAALLYIATNVAVVCWLTSGQGLYRIFMLQPPNSPVTVWQAAFMVVVADSLVRFCGLAPKLLVVAAVQSCWGSSSSSKNSRRQARLLTLLEYLVMGYRALVPIPVWYTYLITCTLNSVLCSILAGFYLTFKGYCLLQQGQLVLVAAKLVIRSATSGGALVGSYLAKGEAGDTCCPICQEPADAAVKLECSHIYCEDCISEWLERDKQATCPMCRTHIQPPGLQSFGDGATTLLPQLF